MKSKILEDTPTIPWTTMEGTKLPRFEFERRLAATFCFSLNGEGLGSISTLAFRAVF